MPFVESLKEIYTEVYKPVCASNEIHCWRVDEISGPGSITRDIIEGILDSDIIIADLTTKNPNVFYELGIAHSTGNKTIMTAQSSNDVPFDIASYRVIFYEHNLTGCKALRAKLDLAIKELLAALNRTNNPFQEVAANRGVIRVKGKTPIFKAIDIRALGTPVRDFIKEKKILYIEDFKGTDLLALAKKPGFGITSLSQICTILSEFELYEDVESFHKFILDYRVDVEHNAVARSFDLKRRLSSAIF